MNNVNLPAITDQEREVQEAIIGEQATSIQEIADAFGCSISKAKEALASPVVQQKLLQVWQAEYHLAIIPALINIIKDKYAKPTPRIRASKQLELIFSRLKPSAPQVQINQNIHGDVDQIIRERYEKRIGATE